MVVHEAAFETPGGNWVRMLVRDDTSDWNTCNAITKVGDEYHLPKGQTGWAVDVGAHIGAWTVALLTDNPGMRCLAIEALPENVELINGNLALNGLTDRAMVVNAAASVDDEPVVVHYSTDPHHRFIGSGGGSGEAITLPTITLTDIIHGLDRGLNVLGVDRVALLKIDCEGCEYPFLTSPDIERVDRIEGEVHFGSAQLRRILEPTHDVVFPAFDANPDFGPFTATRRVDQGEGPE